MEDQDDLIDRKGPLDPFSIFDKFSNEGERKLAQLEPAWGKAATFFRTGQRFGHLDGSVRCMSLLEVHRLLGVYRTRFEAGDTLSLLQAVSFIAEENLPLPQWLAEAFRKSMTTFLTPGKASSLDDVFRSETLPTNSAKRAAAARLDWQLGVRLYHDVWDMILKDETVTSFDKAVERLLVSAEYGVGKTTAKSLIMKVDRSQSQFLGKESSLSQFLAKRRKLVT